MNSLNSIKKGFDCALIRKCFPIFRQSFNGRKLHYLDNASTSQIPSFVVEIVNNHEVTSRANIQRGSYSLAERATGAYESSRNVVAKYINAYSADEVVFTSGTTASLNLLAHSLGKSLKVGDEVVLSELEHHSNIIPWQNIAASSGAVIRYIPVGPDGCLDLTALPWCLSEKTKIISVTHCSNVTGAITDVKALVTAARSVNALIILDGAQGAPHGPLDVQELDVDFYAFSGHKCYGPNGVGVLWGRKELLDGMPPYMTGGGMIESVCKESYLSAPVPSRFEAGTPPIAQAVGLAAALNWSMDLPWDEIDSHCAKLMDRLIAGLSDIPNITFLVPLNAARRQPILSFRIDGIHAHDLSHILNEHGVAVRGGAHCAELLMTALGCDSTIRASIALYNDTDDIDALISGVSHAVEILL